MNKVIRNKHTPNVQRTNAIAVAAAQRVSISDRGGSVARPSDCSASLPRCKVAVGRDFFSLCRAARRGRTEAEQIRRANGGRNEANSGFIGRGVGYVSGRRSITRLAAPINRRRQRGNWLIVNELQATPHRTATAHLPPTPPPENYHRGHVLLYCCAFFDGQLSAFKSDFAGLLFS